jgi:hypothetical protein
LFQFNRDMRSIKLMASGVPDYGSGRCDRHHETVDSDSEKLQRSTIKKIETRGYSF